jgi:electron transfer flavoprotein beta subunit
MRPLDIIVCMKPVPDPRRWGKLKLDPRTMLLRRGDISAVINPLDRNAIEQAVALGERFGGAVTILSMAPAEAEDQLAEALAMGGDRAVLLSDASFAGADSLATARCLAAGIRKIGQPDMVFCGAYSLDGSTSQVGPQVAELLDLPDLTHVVALAVEEGGVRATCRVDDGQVVCDCTLPALVTFDKEANRPRLPTMRGIMKASATGVVRWTAADLGLSAGEVGLAGSPTQMSNVFAPALGRKGEMLEGPPNQVAASLLEKLRADRLVN